MRHRYRHNEFDAGIDGQSDADGGGLHSVSRLRTRDLTALTPYACLAHVPKLRLDSSPSSKLTRDDLVIGR